MCCSVCSSDSELAGHHVVVSVDLFPAHLNVWCRLWIVSDRIFVTNLTFSSAVANVLLSYASSDARWFISCAQAECCLCAHREAHQRERRRGCLISASGVSCAHRASLISASGPFSTMLTNACSAAFRTVQSQCSKRADTAAIAPAFPPSETSMLPQRARRPIQT